MSSSFECNRCVNVAFEVPSPSGEGRIWLMTGVGQPEQVKLTVERAGWTVAKHRILPDHYPYSAEEVSHWIADARKQGFRIMVTGKDWVKWKAFGVSEQDMVVIEPRIVFVKGEEIWNRVLWGQ